MNDNAKQDLLALRSEILGEIVPLVENSNFDPVQKFELLLSSARISDDPARFRAAYQAVKQIEDNDTKVNALLDLLDSIEEVTADTPQSAPEPVTEPQNEE